MNFHPHKLLDSLVFILLIIESDICINTKKYKYFYDISGFNAHDKDLWNGPEKKYEIIRK